MIKIAPSILSADFANLERDIQRIAAADYVHVDVMDGVFVPNITIGIPVVAAIRKVTELPLDVHLMIDRPVRYVEQFCQAGADIVTVHVEADSAENTDRALDIISAQGKRAGVVLKPGTPAEAALPFLDKCSMVLVMTVKPGFGGQKLMPECLDKVRQVRAMVAGLGLKTDIEVDGGISWENAGAIVKNGADLLVSGVFASLDRQGDLGERTAAFRVLSNHRSRSGPDRREW